MSIPTAAAPDHVSVSYCLLDAGGEVLAADDADHPYYAASTIKLHVLLAALLAADADTLDLDESVTATRTFTGSDGATFTLGGDHLDATHPADGEQILVRELLQRMIDRSSNEATNHVVELVGLEAVAGAIASLGLTATRMERLIGDASALESGATNETSAADLAVTMRALVRPAEGLSASSADSARTVLRMQRIPVIAAALREGVPWGSKSGWVEGFRHDAAFIGEPDSADLRLLAIMTAGMEQDDADERIAALVRAQLPDVAAAARL